MRLMTIHRAKGLEFDTVCVADLGRSPRPPYELDPRRARRSSGIRLARSGVGGRTSALDYDALGLQEREAVEREERRLFYVAMTRARERLILSGATKFDGWTDGRPTGGGPIAWIAPAFVPDLGRLIGEGGGTVQVGGSSVLLSVAVPEDLGPTAPGPAPAGSEPGEWVEPEPPPLEPATPGPAVRTISYSALGAHARCGYRFYAERVLGLPPLPDREPAGEGTRGERSATERGVLLHALLERITFRAPLAPTPDTVAAAAAGAGLAPPSPAEAQALAEVVARFADSELCRRLGARDRRPPRAAIRVLAARADDRRRRDRRLRARARRPGVDRRLQERPTRRRRSAARGRVGVRDATARLRAGGAPRRRRGGRGRLLLSRTSRGAGDLELLPLEPRRAGARAAGACRGDRAQRASRSVRPPTARYAPAVPPRVGCADGRSQMTRRESADRLF